MSNKIWGNHLPVLSNCFNRLLIPYFCVLLSLQELQDLEQSNSAFLKEIAELKKDLLFYQMTLERHKPYCCLRASGSSSPSSCCSRSPNYHQANSSPLQASNSPSPFDLTVRTPSPPAPSSTPAAVNILKTSSPSTSSPSPVMVCNPAGVSTWGASLSGFSKLPLAPLNLSSKVSAAPSPIPHTAAQSPDMSSPIESFTDYVLAKLDASLAAAPKTQVPIACMEAKNTRAVKQDFSMSHPRALSGNPSSLSWPYGLIPASYQASPALTASGQTLQTSLPPVGWKQNQQASFRAKSLHSLLTGPSPLDIYQACSSIPNLSFSQTQATVPDTSQDVSLSELLEFNDWILSGPAEK